VLNRDLLSKISVVNHRQPEITFEATGAAQLAAQTGVRAPKRTAADDKLDYDEDWTIGPSLPLMRPIGPMSGSGHNSVKITPREAHFSEVVHLR
jgi:hypothetical protein